jgi:hypothetical protein
MNIRVPSFALFLLPALLLLNPGSPAVAAAPAQTPTSDLKPGLYWGVITITTLHSYSLDTTGASVSWTFDMVESVGQFDLTLPADGSWKISVDIPVVIDLTSISKIKADYSQCKGWRITGSGYGTAKGDGSGPPGLVPRTSTGPFSVTSLEFALSSMSARIRKDGECPSETWGSDARTAVDDDFTNIFSSRLTFTAARTGAASLSGTCQIELWGHAEGQILKCSWRAYWVPSE